MKTNRGDNLLIIDNYTITHAHSDLSNGVTNIDSITKFEEYVDYAASLGMKAFAFTEHGSVFSWTKKKAYIEKKGMKYIHAQEFYVTEELFQEPQTEEYEIAFVGLCESLLGTDPYEAQQEIGQFIEENKIKVRDNYHVILIAKNYDGVLELNKLSSQAFNREDGHFYYMPRISFDELINTSDNIVITTACLGGILHNGNEQLKERFIEFLTANKHRCYLEIQHHNDADGEQGRYNQYLYGLSKEKDIPLIVGTDTHALNEEHLEGRKLLQKAKGVHFANEDSWDLTFKTFEELIEAFKLQNALPIDVVLQAVKNGNDLADSIEEFVLDKSYKYPHLWDNPEQTFMDKIEAGIKRRGVDKYPNYQEYLDRIDEELKAYRHNGAIDFMLLMEDIIDWCIDHEIYVGYGRGSCNGSVIAWLLGITEMDSIKHKLNFQRFMNVERVSLSDIDTDFPPSRIKEVKDYIFSKTGLYCSDIITFNTIADKGAIRDVARGLYKYDVYELLSVKWQREYDKYIETSKMMNGPGYIYEMPKDLKAEVDKVSTDYLRIAEDAITIWEEDEKAAREKYPDIFRYVDLVKGTIVSVGSHPCFLGDTLVFTTDGYKRISDVKVGDKVLTHTGNYKEVAQVMVSESNDIYEVKSSHIPIYATGNHPFYVRERNDIKIKERKYGINTTIRNYGEPIWKDVESLKKGDMIGTPVNKNSIVPNFEEYNLDFKNKNFWWLVGRYIGDGWITDVANRSESYLVVCCNKNGNEKADIVKKLVLLNYDYRIEERDTVFRIYIKNNDLLDYLRRYGKYADGKYLPQEVFDLPVELLEYFILGYMSADGCFTGSEYSFKTVSKKLALGLSLCISKVYRIHTKCQIIKEHEEVLLGRNVKCKEKYIVRFHTDRREKERSFYENGYVWTYCYGAKKAALKEKVYNLSVYDDNSYTVNNMAVHNCGTIVAPHDVTDTFGVFTTSTSEYPISQINMKEVDALNYVKLDLLKLDTIELINETCKLAGIERLTPDNVDILDIKVWDAIRDDTTQIFQWEGNTGQSYIKKLLSDENIEKFQELDPNVDRMTLLSIGNSAIRPAGASYRDDLANGVVRKTGSVAIDEFLSNTFGYLVFQCQIIDFLHLYCGYTMGEADIVRRGFAKKTGTEEHIPRIKAGFIKTMTEKYGSTVEKAEEDIVAFIQVIEDASNYLFSLNHSQPYSYEGYVSGWLRTYYPLEFLTTAFNINQDKEEKTKGLTEYAKKVGIKIELPKFRYSKAGYFCDKNTNIIYKGICSIKFMNEAISNELYDMRNMQFENFSNVLGYIKENTSVNSRQLDILIKLDFFSEFGGIDYLLASNDLFNKYHGKKQMKKDKALLDKIDFDVLRKYSGKETPKTFSELDSNGLLKELISLLPNKETSLKTKIAYQIENLGYVDIVDKKYSGYCVVTDINVDYSPKLKLYALANGNTIPVKIDKKTYAKNQARRGDIIKVENQYRKNKMKKVNGKWVESDEKEWWLSEYKICKI